MTLEILALTLPFYPFQNMFGIVSFRLILHNILY